LLMQTSTLGTGNFASEKVFTSLWRIE
jgi:hypothetical protein